MQKMKCALSIAGTDPSGGAGMQADLKTFAAHGVYGMGAVTAIVAQNTNGVFAVQNAAPEILAAQLEAVFADIFPDSLKIGMIPDAISISVIADALRNWKPANIVIDTVMVSTSGRALMEKGAEASLIREIFPLADLITPNLSETEVLCGFPVRTKTDMIRASEQIAKLCKGAILIKGGHLEDSCDDLLFSGGTIEWFTARRIETGNTHGTGCTLSAAIAANLALGMTLSEAVAGAKRYLTAAILDAPGFGRGNGPVNHSVMYTP